MEVRPRKACSFSTSSRMLRSAEHHTPTKCSRCGAMGSGHTQATRPNVIALQPGTPAHGPRCKGLYELSSRQPEPPCLGAAAHPQSSLRSGTGQVGRQACNPVHQPGVGGEQQTCSR